MNKFSFFLIISIIVLITSDWINQYLAYIFPTGSRHIILFLSFFVPYLFSSNIKRSGNLIFPFFVFVGLLFILIISFNFNAPLISSILSFFSLFLFLFVFIFALNTNVSLITILHFLKVLIIILLLFSIQPIVLAIIDRDILRYHFGFFREVGALGSFMNIGTIMCLTLYLFSGRKFYIYFALLFSAIVFYTVLKKVIISNIFVWLFFILRISTLSKGKKYIYTVGLVVLITLLSFTSFISDNLTENTQYLENVGAEGHVRIAMYLTAYKLAIINFPFGSGLASYGSLGSIFGYYSPIYYQFGIDSIGANAESDVLNSHHTLLDTFWPHILGELGFIGAFLYVYLYIYPILYLNKLKTCSNKNYKPAFFFIYTIILCSFWEGFTLYTPEIPIFIFINFGISGLFISALNREIRI
jgi:hypothetical protein